MIVKATDEASVIGRFKIQGSTWWSDNIAEKQAMLEDLLEFIELHVPPGWSVYKGEPPRGSQYRIKILGARTARKIAKVIEVIRLDNQPE